MPLQSNSISASYSLTFNTIPGNQGISFNGKSYFSGNAAGNLSSGSYPITALAAGNYLFLNWITSGNATIANATAYNTSLTLNGNGSISANFNEAIISPENKTIIVQNITSTNARITGAIVASMSNLNIPVTYSNYTLSSFNDSHLLNQSQINSLINGTDALRREYCHSNTSGTFISSVNMPGHSNSINGSTNKSMNISVTMLNFTQPYGSLILNGTPVSSSPKLYTFSSINKYNGSVYLYHVKIAKAVPKVDIQINGINFTPSNNSASETIHLPIIRGHLGITGNTTYPLSVTISSNVLNQLQFNYVLKNLGTGGVLYAGTATSASLAKHILTSVPVTESVSISVNVSGNNNYTNVDPVVVPVDINNYVPITMAYNGLAVYPNTLQQAIPVNEINYTAYISYNGNLANFEFFYANGTILPSWIESNSSNVLTVWLSISNTIYVGTGSSSASNTIYLGFASPATNLLNNVDVGEAPHLSSTYAQYDDGADVFDFYASGASTSGWTTAGTAGQTSAAPSGNSGFGTNAFYANGAGGDYLYKQAPRQSTSMILEFYGYVASLQDLFFLSSSAGAGQMIRDGHGSGWYGLASTSSWTSWAAPPNTGTWSDEWVTVGMVIVSGTASGYLSVGANPYGSEIGSNPTNQYTAANDGNYIGLVGEGGGVTESWAGVIVRSYPPNNVMPIPTFGSITSSAGIPTLSIIPLSITYGGTSTITTTGNPNTDTIELFLDGNLIGGPSTGTITYTFNSVSTGNGVGAYAFNAFDENTLKNSILTLTVNKAVPSITLPNFPLSFIYDGAPAAITANIVSINDQLSASDYVNGNLVATFTTQNSFAETSAGLYTITANTLGDGNYLGASVSNTLPICPAASSVPATVVAYSCITLTNAQSTPTPVPFQQMLTVNSLAYKSYEAGNLDNIDFFYGNGSIIPSWLESGNSNTVTNTVYWLNIVNGMPAAGNVLAYMGFASPATNLMSNSVTGEAPQLSGAYAEYDDGNSIFDYYNANPTSTAGWTIAGSAGNTSSAPSGDHYSTANALYAYSANGDYIYAPVNGLSTNEIISFNVYTTGLGNLFFLVSSAGAGQMARLDSRGGGDYSGLASSSSWTLWTAPTGLDENANTWYKYDVVMAGTVATSYIGPSSDGLSVFGQLANTFNIADNGNYLGLVGDGLGSSYITYWNGFVVRAYPPNGVMPTTEETQPITSSSTCTISLSPTSLLFGSVNPMSNTLTDNAILDTNSGNANADMFVYGTNWASGSNNFGVSNTLWDATSQATYAGTALTLSAASTGITVSSTSSNDIYFGVGVPGGASYGTYSQTITIENSC